VKFGITGADSNESCKNTFKKLELTLMSSFKSDIADLNMSLSRIRLIRACVSRRSCDGLYIGGPLPAGERAGEGGGGPAVFISIISYLSKERINFKQRKNKTSI